MAAPKGNQFWKARTKHGRDKLFSSSEALWEACCEYFEWVEANPLIEMKPFAYQGQVVQEPVPKMRAMTKAALYLFLDIDRSTWDAWKSSNDFSAVCARAEDVMYSQKLTGSAADLLNANIIARELGLRDDQKVENTHRFSDISDEELENRIKALENELKSAD